MSNHTAKMAHIVNSSCDAPSNNVLLPVIQCAKCNTSTNNNVESCVACVIKRTNFNTVETRSKTKAKIGKLSVGDATTDAITPSISKEAAKTIHVLQLELESKNEIIKVLKNDLEQVTNNLNASKCKYNELIAKIGPVNTAGNGEFRIAKKTCKAKVITEPTGLQVHNTFELLDSDFPEIRNHKLNNKAGNTNNRNTVVEASGDKIGLTRKVLLVADSQGRGCNKMLQSKLGAGCKVQSLLKPNAPLQEVIKDIDTITKDFGVNDVVIVMGGSNNIEADTPYDVLKRDVDMALVKLLPLSNKTNLIINPIPIRYDISGSHDLIKQANHHLHSQLNVTQNINKKRIAINFEIERLTREHFTRQGLHLNHHGKNHICNRSAALVKLFNTVNPVTKRKITTQLCLDKWIIKLPNNTVKRPNHFLD